MEDRRKNKTFFTSPPIIGAACLLVCCVCLGAFLKCKDNHCCGSGDGSNALAQIRAYAEPSEEEMNYWRLRIRGPTTRDGSSTGSEEERRTGCPPTTREGANPPSHVTAPLLPSEKQTSDQNGPELPPSYATAVLEDDKVAELDAQLDQQLDQRLAQQKEVIDAQNARLAEQEAKLAQMSRRLVENEQITAPP